MAAASGKAASSEFQEKEGGRAMGFGFLSVSLCIFSVTVGVAVGVGKGIIANQNRLYAGLEPRELGFKPTHSSAGKDNRDVRKHDRAYGE